MIGKSGKTFDIVEVVGMWDDGTAQKVTADAIAVHKKFDGAYTQGGSTGMIRAFMDAGHPFIPSSNEGENGARKLCAEHSADGLKCSSAGQTPALVAIAIKAALAALQGEVVPQYVSVPIPYVEDPNFKDGENFYSDQTDNFFVANAFPACGVGVLGHRHHDPDGSRPIDRRASSLKNKEAAPPWRSFQISRSGDGE